VKNWRSAAAIIVAVSLVVAAYAAMAAEETPPIGFKALVGFEKLPLLADWPCHQASSYSRENVNADAGNFIRVEPNGEQVMLEAEGPGCIYRVWTTGVIEPNVPIQNSDEARILMYFDGEEKPRIDLSVPEMFGLRGTYPFIPPLSRSFESGRGAWEGHASICYVPIPFGKSIKVTGKKMSFYHVDYYLFPKGTPLKSFTMDVAPADLEDPRRGRRGPEASCLQRAAARQSGRARTRESARDRRRRAGGDRRALGQGRAAYPSRLARP
jgi:hypothetical protein